MITGKILKLNGWPEGKVIGLAKEAGEHLMAEGMGREQVLELLALVRTRPEDYLGDPALGELARECQKQAQRRAAPIVEELRPQPLDYRVWGREYIDPAALDQMSAAMRLPVSHSGALMPDAHVGYGLPIGGVLATEGVVIPYGVGVDIGCRMRLSVYPVAPAVLDQRPELFKKALLERTKFGAGVAWEGRERAQHEVLDDPAWGATRLLASLQQTAVKQLGTSGTGK